MRQDEIKKLSALYHEETFTVLRSLAVEMVNRWSETRNDASSEFAYLKDAIGKEKKAEGIQEFLNEIEKLSQKK